MRNAKILSQEPLSLLISSSINTALCLTFIYLIYALTVALYNITLHPLAKFPGPKLRGAFCAIDVWHIWLGDVHLETKRLHDIYGETVRVRPNALSFNNAQAWKDIYGHRPGKGIIPKAPEMYEVEKKRPGNIITTSNDSEHSRIRRLLSPAFSENALQQQEAILNHYFELLISKLRDNIRNSTAAAKVNLTRWYHFTTFDIISDLCFGESFEMLEKEEYDLWIANIFKGVKVVELFRILRVYPIVGTPILYLLQNLPMVTKARRKHQQYSMDKVAKRLDSVTDRRDFLSYIPQHNDEKGMSREEIGTLSETLLIGGSETTATLLCGVTFFLLTNPDSLQKLTDEVRNSFFSAADITLRSLTKLPYLQACLDEALRLYPPVASTLPRLVRPEGDVVNGQFIPGGTTVGVNSWSAGRSERNFKDSSKYIPERWLRDQDNRYIDDDRASIQPFSLGPRNCIGQNLAYAEMRAILARMVWNFDMELCEDSRNWTSQKVFILWEKPDLNVRLSERVV